MTNFFTSIRADYTKQLILLVFLELLVFLISGVGYTSISNAPYFNIGVDPLYWIFYGLSIPQTIMKYPTLAITFDFLTIGFLLLAFLKFNEKWIRITVLLLLLYYVTLSGYLGHRNYQSGFVWVLMPLMFKTEKNKILAFEMLRYWLLFFYLSSAFFKISGNGIVHFNHLTSIFEHQFSPYYMEQNFGFRTQINSYLINHSLVAHLLFVFATGFEFFAIFGFFTKKLDKLIGALLIIFHLFNWLLMDIAPLGQLSILSIFFVVPFLKNDFNQVKL
jgi:hypothetical protein